jgi:hypothetical protein
VASRVEWPGLKRLSAQLQHLKNIDCEPLMLTWAAVLIEGNRRGVLAGLDGNDRPMDPLKYRDGHGKKTANRQAANFGTTRLFPAHNQDPFKGKAAGPYASGFDDNLTTREYQQLTGPRLAPQREASRVIKNLRAMTLNPAPGVWQAVAAWDSVVSRKGFPFLMAHFEPGGGSRLPRYDLRPVRPRDYAMCLNYLRAFAKSEFLDRV